MSFKFEALFVKESRMAGSANLSSTAVYSHVHVIVESIAANSSALSMSRQGPAE